MKGIEPSTLEVSYLNQTYQIIENKRLTVRSARQARTLIVGEVGSLSSDLIQYSLHVKTPLSVGWMTSSFPSAGASKANFINEVCPPAQKLPRSSLSALDSSTHRIPLGVTNRSSLTQPQNRIFAVVPPWQDSLQQAKEMAFLTLDNAIDWLAENERRRLRVVLEVRSILVSSVMLAI